jgi:hypothetical protein
MDEFFFRHGTSLRIYYINVQKSLKDLENKVNSFYALNSHKTCSSHPLTVCCPISFRVPEIFWTKSNACYKRFQNSLSAQALGIAYLVLRQDLSVKMFQWPHAGISFRQQAVN